MALAAHLAAGLARRGISSSLTSAPAAAAQARSFASGGGDDGKVIQHEVRVCTHTGTERGHGYTHGVLPSSRAGLWTKK